MDDDADDVGTSLLPALYTDPWDRPGTGLLPIGMAGRIDAGRAARRVPYLAVGATAAAGYAAFGIAELAALGGGEPAQTAALAGTWALSAIALPVLRLTYRDRIDRAWSRRWWLAGTAATAWVDITAAVGPDWAMTAALAVGAAAVGARWAREHAVPRPVDDPVPGPDPAQLAESVAEVLARKWATRVGCPGGLLPGSKLTDRVDLPRAVRWRVETVPGSTTFAKMFARSPDIAAALNWSGSKMLLEPSEVDEGQAELTVITHDLLAAGVPYIGPRYKDGRVPIGTYADGTGEADYVAYDEVGCRNGLFTGDPGSGKSAALSAVGLGLRHSGEWQLLFGDGDPEAGSSAILNDIAHWPAAGPQLVLAQLEALEALLELRGMLKATLTAGPDGRPVPIDDPTRQRPVAHMLPCPAYPGYVWILDELHRLTSDEWLKARGFVARLERLVRIGRKYGIVLLVGTQSLIVKDYGNSTPLRGYLATRNLFAFRSGNKTEKAVVSGLEISPGVLPSGGGYAFSAHGGRLAQLRVGYSKDMDRHIAGLPESEGDRDSEMALAPFRPAAPLDPTEAFAARRAKLAAWRAKQGGGQVAAIEQTPRPGGLPGVRAVPAGLTVATVTPIRPQPPAPVEDPGPDLEALPAAQRAVYGALLEGLTQTGQIAERTGLRKPAVSKALSALAGIELAHQVRHGVWGLGAGEESAAG